MNITKVTLENNSTVLILENVLPPELLKEAQEFCNTFVQGDPDWKKPWDSPRAVYQGVHPSFDKLKAYFNSPAVIQQFAQALPGRYPAPSEFKIWVDQAGFGALQPHKEVNDAFIAQVFVTETEHSYTGTTIYNDNKEILFQLPYRNNCGWFFDNGSTVMHGRAHDVPEGINRYAIMIWYGSEIRL